MASPPTDASTIGATTAGTALRPLLLLRAMRPRQWIKNGIVFAALIFSSRFFEPEALVRTSLACLAFCALSSGTYLVNDIADAEKDRQHPRKRRRPIASGELRVGTAASAAALLALGALAVGFWLGLLVGVILLTYFLLNLGYSFWLKRVVILDIMILASGFVLRAIVGAVAISVYASAWLFVVTLFLALFLALTKRRAELVSLGENGSNHRVVLKDYSVSFLDQMIMIASTAALISYALYTFNSIHSDAMMITLPFVLYAVFRYLYLVYQRGMGENPAEVFLSDWPFLANMILYVATVAAILGFLH